MKSTQPPDVAGNAGIVMPATSTNGQQPPSLYQLLKSADLLEYNDKLRSILKLRHAGDLDYTEEKDLTQIGMSRPEQKRLRREYLRLYPQSSLVVKLRKVFGRVDARKNSSTLNGADGEDVPNEQHIIGSDAIELCRELGRGEFGICFQGTWTLPHGDSLQVAIKRVPPEKLKSNPICFLQEAAVMTRMRHEHVIRMHGVVLDTKSVMLVSELAVYGSLLDCLRKPAWDEPFAVDTLCKFARQIASGMAYLAGQRLIHRDLAARNVLVSALTKVKISDFGLSRWLGVNEEYYRSDFSPATKLPIAWCAPECINILRFTSASDVYAFGVTLWEMFSYGQMPWQGYTGSQILHTIDTQRKFLECPDACPSQFYSLMQRCWAHDADQRPKFDEILDLIPNLMPQLLVAATDCRNNKEGWLQFTKGDTIILLDKYRDLTATETSSFWHGTLRNGCTGLFKPEETVAYLGAENPSTTRLIPLANGQVEPKKEKKKPAKLTDKERRKLLISEPQNDLRHTCHIGLDGKVLELIQATKNDLSKSLSPLIGLHDPATLVNAPSYTGTVTTSPVSPAARSTIALSTSSTCSSGSNQNPKQNRHSATSPTIASVRELGNAKIDTIVMNGYDIPHRMPKSVQLEPPALPPKPAARIKPQRSLATEQVRQSATRGPLVAHRTQSLPKSTTNSASLLTSTTELTRPKSITAETEFFVDSKATTEPVDNMSQSFHNSSQLLDEVLTTLQRDISDFSFSTINDFSDTRQLIAPKKQQSGYIIEAAASTQHVRPLTEPETERLSKRITDEHKKAARSLAKEFQEFQRLSSVEKPASTGKVESGIVSDNYSSKIGASSTGEEWSSEAQAAYKLLIECGDYLKSTSPISDRMSTKSPSACVSSSTDTESTIRNLVPPPLPPKKIQYINNTLIGSEDSSNNNKLEQVEVIDQRQLLEVTENHKNVKLDVESEWAPQIPPKPKTRHNLPRHQDGSGATEPIRSTDQSGRRFAQRSALFSSFPKDEGLVREETTQSHQGSAASTGERHHHVDWPNDVQPRGLTTSEPAVVKQPRRLDHPHPCASWSNSTQLGPNTTN